MMPDIDGFLVGGASLISAEFLTIINSVNKKH
jgi:triosephosphate isomerase